MKHKHTLFFFSLLLMPTLLTAQANDPSLMESCGKINVVVGVMLIIFAGIISFLIYMERRIEKIEKDLSK